MVGDFRIEEWLVQPQLNSVVCPGNGSAKLEPKVMEVLVYLADHAGEVVSKEAVFQAVWRDTFVTDDALIRCIVELRKIFGDDVRKPRVIQTIARKGYRLIGEVNKLAEAQSRYEIIRKLGQGGMEERNPYPGLSSFTEKDAAHFFGREAEVKALWQRLQNRKLLAVIGPSGTGKTSFVRAGVIPAAPEGWRCLWVTPGDRPFAAVARALVPELANDPETLQRLVGAETGEELTAALSVWRRRHGEALLGVDQFEELFTLNPGEVQERFAAFLGRLASEADVHVLISVRDDFLMRCHEQPALAAVFTELTPLGVLTKEGLRRALAEPAKKLGYGFEDEALVEEIVESVEQARAALPLLAFAVSRLWEQRDRERKLLTRAAYEEIGGVAGALAQHAEAVMDRIGTGQGVVREIFRNLVTAQGTRAVVDRDELLSAFPDKREPEVVLRELIDARLVTSYEVEGRGGEASHHRVEVVHESLLTAWPRLVRWQAQDEEGVVLRDQLKQAAHLWEERGRPVDLLWSGTSFREYELWRERYPGTLTALEEDFARSMAEQAQRQKRRRRLAVAFVVAAALLVAAVTGALWRKSEAARERAAAAALRAEASKLLALGRLDLETHPTAALAYTRNSLELTDTPEARRFAVEILWRGPVARILPVAQIAEGLGLEDQTFSRIVPCPDGRWYATRGLSGQILLFPRDGGLPLVLPRRPKEDTIWLGFGPQSDLLITGERSETLHFWTLPDLREIRSAELGGVGTSGLVRHGRLFTLTQTHEEKPEVLLRIWPLPDGEPKVLGTFNLPPGLLVWDRVWDIDPSGTLLAYSRDRTIRVRPLDASRPASERILGSIPDELRELSFAPKGDRLASIDKSSEIRLWSLAVGARAPLRILEGPKAHDWTFPLLLNSDGSLLTMGTTDGSLYVWDLDGPPDAQPTILRRPDEVIGSPASFDPSGQWLAAGNGRTVAFWPVSHPRIRALQGNRWNTHYLPFTADGRFLASCGISEPARMWPLSPADGGVRALAEDCFSIAMHPAGTHLLVATETGKLFLAPMGGGQTQQLLDQWQESTGIYRGLAFDAQGRRAVASPYTLENSFKDPKQRVLRVWDLESGQERIFSVADITDSSWIGFMSIAFAGDGSLFVSGQGGVRRLMLPAEPGGKVSTETVCADKSWTQFDLSRDGRHMLVWGTRTSRSTMDGADELLLLDLREHTSRRITTHGGRIRRGALDAYGRVIVTADVDGVVRAGPATGEEPHLLLGQTGSGIALGVSPDGRWIASSSNEVIHLWPMPDLSKPPLHTLPYNELMEKLRALTNLQVVEDKTAANGYKLEIRPFPGWKDVPTW